MLRAAITGIQGYVPDYILRNEELEQMVETNDEWIQTRTGIKERRILNQRGLGTSDMAVPAVNSLLEKKNISPSEIELVICATVTPDMQFPATANIISDKAGLKNAFGYDINAACCGFLYALTTAAKFIETGVHQKVLLVGADKMSSIIDYEDRATCVIFGDGAGAVLLEPDHEGNGIINSKLYSDGSGSTFLHQKAGGSVKPASHATVDAHEHYVYQDGRTVFKFAVNNMAEVAKQVMNESDLTPDNVHWLVPHQANKRIIEATYKQLNLNPDKVMVNIERYGNTTNATIPLCLWEWEDQINKGDNLILAAFGGGFTWGATYMRWSY
ncbi:MAG: 3-oxoacyl-ACP synthase [Bacteroidetes bacterium SW_11_45_7]|nr:MAG: 3-oxoacyl-ACP synthase [Bacteroidetes bacterium SW_11_45_7]